MSKKAKEETITIQEGKEKTNFKDTQKAPPRPNVEPPPQSPKYKNTNKSDLKTNADK